MQRKMFRNAAFLAITAVLLSGCGGGSSSSSTPDDTETGYTVTPRALAEARLLDANNTPLVGAEISLADDAVAPSMARNIGTYAFAGATSDADGMFSVDLPAGTYRFQVYKNGTTTYLVLIVDGNNGASTVSIVAPISCTDLVCEDLSDYAIVASISGIVHSPDGPIEGAQVAISGGAATNGAFATAITDGQGRFSLVFNVNRDLQDALSQAVLLVSKPGFKAVVRTVNATEGNRVGQNVLLQALSPEQVAGEVVWRETFESDSMTRDQWIVDDSRADPDVGDTGWRLLEAGHGIVNGALGLDVNAAPDDVSPNAVPNPIQGSVAYWYGNPVNGNFIGVRYDYHASLDGGTSVSAHYGTLTTPSIDLSGIAAGQPLSLAFQTWWEIEAVNPNENGFDLMGISVSTDGGATWNLVARLNPLSDPQSNLDLEPLPFSNRGFNAAPHWILQEAIPLQGAQGKSDVRIRFEFSTEDDLYNGFRGWLIDDVVIQQKQGTFPIWQGGADTLALSAAQIVPGVPSKTLQAEPKRRTRR